MNCMSHVDCGFTVQHICWLNWKLSKSEFGKVEFSPRTKEVVERLKGWLHSHGKVQGKHFICVRSPIFHHLFDSGAERSFTDFRLALFNGRIWSWKCKVRRKKMKRSAWKLNRVNSERTNVASCSELVWLVSPFTSSKRESLLENTTSSRSLSHWFLLNSWAFSRLVGVLDRIILERGGSWVLSLSWLSLLPGRSMASAGFLICPRFLLEKRWHAQSGTCE